MVCYFVDDYFFCFYDEYVFIFLIKCGMFNFNVCDVCVVFGERFCLMVVF